MDLLKLNRRSGLLTLASVFLLLIAGGVVRSTGSGMGCPDWPKCYGAYFPPTCECELPANYQSIYLEKRLKKVDKFAHFLSGIGLQKQAQVLLDNEALKVPEKFNPQRAWTEYINRLIGVLSGLFSLVYVLSLILTRKHHSSRQFWLGVTAFVLMMFNAWLGSIVVATNLFPIIISIHYLATYFVIGFIMLQLFKPQVEQSSVVLLKYQWFYLFFVLMSLVQVVYGAALRQVTDAAIVKQTLYHVNEVNFSAMGTTFKAHWVFAVALILLSVIPLYSLREKVDKKWYRLSVLLPLVLLVQYISGVWNLRFKFPLLPQVSHIFFAGLIFGISLYICIAVYNGKKSVKNRE
jgi:cytochrome c oxidase assembly protein subunit 15